MNVRNIIENIVGLIPTVRRPVKNVNFKQKIFWTVSMLILYFVMTNVDIYGLNEQDSGDALGQFRSILAGAQGSIFQLGIMPIVTASIVLQIVTGSNLLPLDLNDPRDQKLYQGLKRGLIFVMIMVNAFPLVYGGGFLVPDPVTASTLGVPVGAVQFFIFLQIVVGGMLIYYMDEVVSKWGIGSGLGLFIIAGISQRFVGGIFTQLLTGWWQIITGQVALSFSASTAQTLLFGAGNIVPLITTIGIFAVVVAAERTRVEIPVKHSKTGQRSSFDVKLIYASVLPIILVRAIQANAQFIGQGLDSVLGTRMPQWLGEYTGANSQVTGGLFYVLTPIFTPEDWMWFLSGSRVPIEATTIALDSLPILGTVSLTLPPVLVILRILVDLTFMVVGGAVFALFWIRTTNKDAKATAKQLEFEGLRIPGFRSNSQIMQTRLERYIPYVTVLGGALIGLLAVLASMLGTIGGVTGTGLLLAVSITSKIYDELKQEWLESQLGAKYGFSK